jgi:hypothetical protein
MQDFTTYLYLVDSKTIKTNELIDINRFMNDFDDTLQKYLKETILKPNDKLIHKTLLRIKQSL